MYRHFYYSIQSAVSLSEIHKSQGCSNNIQYSAVSYQQPAPELGAGASVLLPLVFCACVVAPAPRRTSDLRVLM